MSFKIIPFILLVLITGSVFSQQTLRLQESSSPFSSVPLGGANSSVHFRSIYDSTHYELFSESQIQIIRYPGGTESNTFDYTTGQILPHYKFTYCPQKQFRCRHDSLRNINTTINDCYRAGNNGYNYPFTPNNFKSFLDSIKTYSEKNIKPLFVLNVLSPEYKNISSRGDTLVHNTIEEQVQLIKESFYHENGDSILLELGNEMYLDNVTYNQFYPNAYVYAQKMDSIIDIVKAIIPTAKVSISLCPEFGEGTTKQHRWNRELIDFYTKNQTAFHKVNAFNYHKYTGMPSFRINNTRLDIHADFPSFEGDTLTKAMQNLMASAHSFEQNHILSEMKNGLKFFENKEMWITEYEMLCDGFKTKIARTYSHALYTSILTLHLLEIPNLNILTSHSAIALEASYRYFNRYEVTKKDSTYRPYLRLSTKGIFHKEIYKALEESDSIQQIYFVDDTNIRYDFTYAYQQKTENIPKVKAWALKKNNNIHKIILVNGSENDFELKNQTSSKILEITSSDINAVDIDLKTDHELSEAEIIKTFAATSSVLQNNYTTKKNIAIPPYSFVVIEYK